MHKILIVDDDTVSLQLLGYMLDKNLYLTTAVHTATLAFQALGNMSPALVIIDFRLPEINGIELTQMLRVSLETQHIPILMISADMDYQTMKQAFEAGCNEIVMKPLRRCELLDAIQKILSPFHYN